MFGVDTCRDMLDIFHDIFTIHLMVPKFLLSRTSRKRDNWSVKIDENSAILRTHRAWPKVLNKIVLWQQSTMSSFKNAVGWSLEEALQLQLSKVKRAFQKWKTSTISFKVPISRVPEQNFTCTLLCTRVCISSIHRINRTIDVSLREEECGGYYHEDCHHICQA